MAEAVERPRSRLLFLLPALVFVALVLLFGVQLISGRNPAEVPSVLIDKPVPVFSLAPLEGLLANGQPVPGFSNADLKGRVTVVNVWASWCAPCRQEHPLLVDLARDPSIRVVGINQKDNPDNARRFLGTLGNPYAAVGVDPNGRASIDWGVYGVPETFIIGPDGTIRHKHIGPLTPENFAGVQGEADAKSRPLEPVDRHVERRQEGRAVFWRKRLRPARHLAHGAQVLHQVAGGERHADGGLREGFSGRADHLGSGLHAAAGQRDVGGDHDGAAPGALGDPVVGGIEAAARPPRARSADPAAPGKSEFETTKTFRP